ncbi:unnamed protein product [Brassica oleracea]
MTGLRLHVFFTASHRKRLSLLLQLLKPEQCISYQVKALLNQRRFQPIIDNVLLRC